MLRTQRETVVKSDRLKTKKKMKREKGHKKFSLLADN